MNDVMARPRVMMRRGAGIVMAGLALLVGVVVRAIVYTPVEVHQGPAQKIFYMHAPAAWSAMLAFSLVGIVSIAYLIMRDERLDRFAACSAEVGLAFSGVMLTTGPIWGKTVWGTWWTWDARLTLTLFMFLLFIGYLSLRSAVTDPGERARFAAVVGILGLALIPFVHLSVYLFRTLHPQPVVLKPSAPTLPADMLITLMASLLVFTVLYIGFVTWRYGIALAADLTGGDDD
ncbi:MAG: cytochrome c biogenesis protein CcsA [Gemmatimonadales bacterium]